MANFLYELGATVRDRMTSFEGTVAARAEWLYGCLTYVVQPRALKDGHPVQSVTFDEGRLELVAPPKPEMLESSRWAKDRDPGGPVEPLPEPLR